MLFYFTMIPKSGDAAKKRLLRNQGGTTAEKQRLSSLDNAQNVYVRGRQTFFISERNEFYDVSRKRRDKRIS